MLDRSGVRIGGVLTDIFGMNGRRILDGLVDRLAREVILASLSQHVRDKLDPLGDALSLALRETDRILLADLLNQHDALTRRVQDFDRRIDEALVPYAEPRRLLETIPGIDRMSACAILIETGPDVAVFGAARRLAAWAGSVSRQQRERRQAAARTRPARQQDAARRARRVRPRRRPYPQLPVSARTTRR